jgi:voltage-gated potassium channel
VRYFIASLIIFGVGTLGYALSSAAQAVIESELLSTFGKRRMYKDISKLSGHYIVCGAGRVGAGVIRDISRSGHDLVVIEGDGVADRRLRKELVLMGDATNGQLKAAGIERALASSVRSSDLITSTLR